MAFESGDFDATLAAAAGEDTALLAELRAAFADSAARHLDHLRRARCDGNWNVAAMRLKGLSASFHVQELILLSEEALTTAPGDPLVIRKIQSFLVDFSESGAPD